MPRNINLPKNLAPEDINQVRQQVKKTGGTVHVYAKPPAGGAAPKKQAAGGGLDADLKARLDALAAGGTGGGPLTPQELKDAKARQAQFLREHLSGPYTPEAILGGYASTVASLYGASYPGAEKLARYGMGAKMSQTTFSQWLRSRPDFATTDTGRKMRADALSVVAQVFGYA